MGTFLNSTGHVETGCGHNFGVSALGKAFKVLLVLGYGSYLVVVMAHVTNAFVYV